MNLMAAIAGAFATLAVAALVGAGAACATFFGCLAGIVLLIVAIVLASIALTFATFAAIAAVQLAVQQAELNTERTRFSNDVSKVLATCPSTCWGDTSLPACPD